MVKCLLQVVSGAGKFFRPLFSGVPSVHKRDRLIVANMEPLLFRNSTPIALLGSPSTVVLSDGRDIVLGEGTIKTLIYSNDLN